MAKVLIIIEVSGITHCNYCLLLNMLSREIIITADGSSTIFIPHWNESYHSRHGSVQEAYHVFIRNGLEEFSGATSVNILEIGFGTGLNAFITLLESVKRNLRINYTGIEKYPVSITESQKLNYPEILNEWNPRFPVPDLEKYYFDLMNSGWEQESAIIPGFNLTKRQADFLDFDYPENLFDLVYFDAFGARVQPELWTEFLFEKLYRSMTPNGIFTTYSAKGSVKRALISVGFRVQKRPGPPGKREMLTAIK